MQIPASRHPALTTFAALLLSALLTACGGGDGGSRLDNGGGGVTNGNGGGTGGDAENEPAQLGHGSADNFIAGEVGVGIGDQPLSPGGTTSLTVTLVNSEGELVTSSVDVTFNSDCLAEGSAILGGADAEGGNSVTITNGRADLTYTANGCVGADHITARAVYQGISAGTARATITVESDNVQTLTFVGADPELISLKGTGGLETSRVTFLVLGASGAPMRDVIVNFSLNTTLGGLALVDESATSNARGEVSTTVQAGTVATSIRVTATTGGVATQSSQLSVSTGIPDQNSMSLSASDLFPVGWNYNGVESELTIHLADAFNNPPPNGTAVGFTTSGGAIQPECLTEGGACTVTWRSQNPKPGKETPQSFWVEVRSEDANNNPVSFDIKCPENMPKCRHGRLQVLATALGNESFIDETGTGLYDGPPDIFATSGNCNWNNPVSSAAVVAPDASDINALACDDLGEAYLDKNFNGVRDSGEEYVDLNGDREYTPGDGIYNGVLCSSEAEAQGLCNLDMITIRDDLMLVMTCERVYEEANLALDPDPEVTFPPGYRNARLGTGEADTVNILLADCNGNGMPPGTSISLDASNANNVDTAIAPNGDLAGSPEPTVLSVSISSNDNDPPSGAVVVNIEAPTPNGSLTTSYTISILPSQ